MLHTDLPLSAIDYVFTGPGAYEIGFAFAYRGIIDPDRLRSSLGRTLEEFWPLRSQLVRLSEDSYAFHPSDDGLVFDVVHSASSIEATSEATDFLDPVQTLEGEPLTRIRLTQTPQGSVLGVSISHALVDGFSYFHFLSSWSRVLCGQRILPPVHHRELLAHGVSASQPPVTPDEVLARSGFFWAGKCRPVAVEERSEERLLLSKEAVQGLLAEAQEECDLPLFPNDAITAHLWRTCIPRWADGSGNPLTFVSCPVDFRRLVRAVPRTYFGCAVVGATASVEFDNLVSAPLGKLALMVRQAVARVREEYVTGALQALERLRRQRTVAALEKILVRHPEHGLVVTNISRLPMQTLDFGAGIPTGFLPLRSADRGAAILPADDGVDVRIY